MFDSVFDSNNLSRKLDRYQISLIKQARKFYIMGIFNFDELIAEIWYVKSFWNKAYSDHHNAQER